MAHNSLFEEDNSDGDLFPAQERLLRAGSLAATRGSKILDRVAAWSSIEWDPWHSQRQDRVAAASSGSRIEWEILGCHSSLEARSAAVQGQSGASVLGVTQKEGDSGGGRLLLGVRAADGPTNANTHTQSDSGGGRLLLGVRAADGPTDAQDRSAG